MSGGLWLGSWVKFWLGVRLAPFVPTPEHVGSQMLRLAKVRTSDTVFDLGCGKGNLLIQAARKYGVTCYGVELDQRLAEEATVGIRQAGLSHLVQVECKDAMAVDLREASVVLLYLSEAGNAKLLPKLARELSPEARVVSFCWPFPPQIAASETSRVQGIPLLLYKGSNFQKALS